MDWMMVVDEVGGRDGCGIGEGESDFRLSFALLGFQGVV
jgi:hypothetical protein